MRSTKFVLNTEDDPFIELDARTKQEKACSEMKGTGSAPEMSKKQKRKQKQKTAL